MYKKSKNIDEVQKAKKYFNKFINSEIQENKDLYIIKSQALFL